jgi:aspartyl-tRNA(Asn)/glutamyl-tRNA(Gln) amidotransferase subunit A
MTQLHNMTVAQLAQTLQTKQASAVEVATAFLARAGGNPHNAFLDIDSEVTLAQAQASDARMAAGTAGALEGVPIAHKDVFLNRQIPNNRGIKIFIGKRNPI